MRLGMSYLRLVMLSMRLGMSLRRLLLSTSVSRLCMRLMLSGRYSSSFRCCHRVWSFSILQRQGYQCASLTHTHTHTHTHTPDDTNRPHTHTHTHTHTPDD